MDAVMTRRLASVENSAPRLRKLSQHWVHRTSLPLSRLQVDTKRSLSQPSQLHYVSVCFDSGANLVLPFLKVRRKIYRRQNEYRQVPCVSGLVATVPLCALISSSVSFSSWLCCTFLAGVRFMDQMVTDNHELACRDFRLPHIPKCLFSGC
jgi:hypothetical protein